MPLGSCCQHTASHDHELSHLQDRSCWFPPCLPHTSSRWQPCSSGSGCSRRVAHTLSTRSARSANSALAASAPGSSRQADRQTTKLSAGVHSREVATHEGVSTCCMETCVRLCTVARESLRMPADCTMPLPRTGHAQLCRTLPAPYKPYVHVQPPGPAHSPSSSSCSSPSSGLGPLMVRCLSARAS